MLQEGRGPGVSATDLEPVVPIRAFLSYMQSSYTCHMSSASLVLCVHSSTFQRKILRLRVGSSMRIYWQFAQFVAELAATCSSHCKLFLAPKDQLDFGRGRGMQEPRLSPLERKLLMSGLPSALAAQPPRMP